MSTYGTRLGIVKQVLGLSYKELLDRLGIEITERSLRNYIDNKTQPTADIISKIPVVFPEVSEFWWHTGQGTIIKDNPYLNLGTESMASEPLPAYGEAQNTENVTIPASELFKALFKDMSEVNQLLRSRLEYYEIFMNNMKKFKI